ncbi:MAG: hypothetical protein AB1730_17910 [Myxococcota bacterium]
MTSRMHLWAWACGVLVMVGCTQQPGNCASNDADSGVELPALDEASLSADMEALRDAVAESVAQALREEARKRNSEAEVFGDPTSLLPQVPWTYAVTGSAEALLVMTRSAKANLLTSLGESPEMFLGHAFLRYPAEGVPGWTETTGHWADWYYVQRRQGPTGVPEPAEFQLRKRGAPGTPDVVIARGPVQCEGCDNPYLPEFIAAQEKPRVRLTVKLSKPVEIDIEIELGKDKNGTAPHALVHLKASPVYFFEDNATERGKIAANLVGLNLSEKVNTARATVADWAHTHPCETLVTSNRSMMHVLGHLPPRCSQPSAHHA